MRYIRDLFQRLQSSRYVTKLMWLLKVLKIKGRRNRQINLLLPLKISDMYVKTPHSLLSSHYLLISQKFCNSFLTLLLQLRGLVVWRIGDSLVEAGFADLAEVDQGTMPMHRLIPYDKADNFLFLVPWRPCIDW